MALHDDSSWMEPGTIPFEWEVRPGVPKYSIHLDENGIEQVQEPAAADDDHQSLKVSAFELGSPPPPVTLSSANTDKASLFVPPGPIFRHNWTKGYSNKKPTTAGKLKPDDQNQHVGSPALSSSSSSCSSTPLLFTSSSSPSPSSASPFTVNICKPADHSVWALASPIFRKNRSFEGSTGHNKKQKLNQWKPEFASPSSSFSSSPSTADEGRKTAGKSVLVPGPMFRHSWAKGSTRSKK